MVNEKEGGKESVLAMSVPGGGMAENYKPYKSALVTGVTLISRGNIEKKLCKAEILYKGAVCCVHTA